MSSMDAEKERIIDVLEAGTEDLLANAANEARLAITTPPGVNFLRAYIEADRYRAEHGSYPEELPEQVEKAFRAVDELKDKRVANLMGDVTGQVLGGTMEAIRESYLINGTPVLVLDEALKQDK